MEFPDHLESHIKQIHEQARHGLVGATGDDDTGSIGSYDEWAEGQDEPPLTQPDKPLDAAELQQVVDSDNDSAMPQAMHESISKSVRMRGGHALFTQNLFSDTFH